MDVIFLVFMVMPVTSPPALLAIIGMGEELANKQFPSVKVDDTDESVPVPLVD